MTRKDYILIAEALVSATPLAKDGDIAYRAWVGSVLAVANAFERDNPRFNRPKFLEACKLA